MKGVSTLLSTIIKTYRNLHAIEQDAVASMASRSPVPSTQAIYLPAAALFAAEALGCDQKGRSQILGCDTQEAEGYLVEPDGSVSLLRRPR